MSVSVVVVRGILAEVERLGVAPATLLGRCELDPARLLDIREMLSVEESVRLVESAVGLTGNPGLGLAIGASVPEITLPLLGDLLRSHSTIRQAFDALQRYGTLVVEGPKWALRERDDLAIFSVEMAVDTDDVNRFCVECTLALSARIGSHFVPSRAMLAEVHFQHAAPSYAARYTEVFRCPVRFDQPLNALLFPRTLLDSPNPHADHTVRTLLCEAADRLLHERTSMRGIADLVRRLLSFEENLATVDVHDIARRVRLSKSSLRRRLKSEGVSLSSLLDEARCRVACRELRHPHGTIKETAELLGFSETSAFFRAFKRWTGRTPAEYRRCAEQASTGGKAPADADQAEARATPCTPAVFGAPP